MPTFGVGLRNGVARRSLSVCGAVLVATSVLLAGGTAAFAKSDMSLTADSNKIKIGQTIRFSGEFDDDADGVNADQVCLWQYVKGSLARLLAPCVGLHQQNGEPLSPGSNIGYFNVSVKAKAPGRLVVVPVVHTRYDPKHVYPYARIMVVVGHKA